MHLTLNLNYEETVDRIMSYSPKYVGITAVTISIHSAAKIAKMLRERNKDIITIIGGPHLTSIPMKTMELFPEFDIGVIGEGEVTIIELLNAYENNMNIKKIPGLIIRKNGELKLTERRSFIMDLDSLPMPAWDLLPDISKYY